MTGINYLGLAGQCIFGVSTMFLLMVGFISCHWKWFVCVGISFLLFFMSSIVAIM